MYWDQFHDNQISRLITLLIQPMQLKIFATSQSKLSVLMQSADLEIKVIFAIIQIAKYLILPIFMISLSQMSKQANSYTYIMSDSNQTFRHWSPEINIKYFLFAALHFRQMEPPQNAIRKDKLFIKMAKWIPQKTHKQCRSHHTKQVNKFQNGFSGFIKEAVRNHFTIRCLPVSHLRLEAQTFLKEIKRSGQIEVKEMTQYMARTDQFIQRYQKKKNKFTQTNLQIQRGVEVPKNATKAGKKEKRSSHREDMYFEEEQ